MNERRDKVLGMDALQFGLAVWHDNQEDGVNQSNNFTRIFASKQSCDLT
jgi:hypothetical protein